MYILVRSRYRLDRRAGRWVEADLADEAIGTLSANYGNIYLYIQYPGAGNPVVRALHWEKMENELGQYDPNMTVQQWLTSIGNRTLPFEDKMPNENLRLVKYAHAIAAGYNFQTKGVDGHISQDISTYYKEDLILTHPVHKPADVRNHCLISVNGYFHLTDYTDEGVRIIDGNKTVIRSKDNQVGLYSFEQLGKLKFVPIKPDMIKSQGEDIPLWNATYLTMPPEIDLEGKTVLLVTGGYLNVLSDVYERVNERIWRLSFGRMMFLNRYLQSVRDMDLSSLGLSEDPDDPTLFNAQEFKHDDVIKAYLGLSQSFFVIVDCDAMFQTFEPVEYLNLPGRFVSSERHQFPLIGAYGRMLDYHIIKEPNRKLKVPDNKQLYIYAATMNKRYDFDAHHRPWLSQKAVNGGAYPGRPFRHETAYYRIIGSEG